LPFVNLTLTTDAVYEKNRDYHINDLDLYRGRASRKVVRSDGEGRLKITLDGSLHDIGINEMDAPPNVSVSSWKIVNMPWATTGKDVSISVSLTNKGGRTAKGITAQLTGTRESVRMMEDAGIYGDIDANKTKKSESPFVFSVWVDSIEVERLKLLITDKDQNEWTDFIDIPLMRDAPDIREFAIADGRMFTVAEAGDDTVSVYLGRGNGDGIANPGESIVILAGDPDHYRRTYLYTSDPFVNPEGINIRISDNWGSYDHVGGSAKYSMPLLSSHCPRDHTVDFFAEYWLPDYPDHIIKRGRITIKVSGEDQTAPVLKWVSLTGDNTIQARIYDGGMIHYAKAMLQSRDDPVKDNPGRTLEVSLNDNGEDGDRIAGDFVFSRKIPEQTFGLYNIAIEAADTYGNIGIDKAPGVYVIH
jgi:hypothetical protein